MEVKKVCRTGAAAEYNMSMNEKEKSSWIKLLGDIIEEEVAKEDGMADMELVEKCEELISALIGDRYNISEEELKSKICQITSNTGKAEGQKTSYSRRNLRKIFARAAAVVLSVILLMGIGVSAACLINPMLLDGIRDVLGGKDGDVIESGSITFIRNDQSVVYENTKDFISSNSLDILFFDDLPDGLNIEEIRVIGDGMFPILVIFNDKELSFVISELNGLDESGYYEENNVIESNGRRIVISNKTSVNVAIYIENGYIYQFTVPDKYNVLELFEYLWE